MSATNLDLPVLISAEQIRRREFVTIRRGYDPDQSAPTWSSWPIRWS